MTKLYLRDTSSNPRPIGIPVDTSTALTNNIMNTQRDLSTTAGSNTVNNFGIGTTPAGAVAAPGLVGVLNVATVVFTSLPLASSVTISGTVTFSAGTQESNAMANAAARYVVWRVTPDLVTSVIVDALCPTEMSTTKARQTWTATPTSTTLDPGDIILVAGYFDDVSNFGSGYSVSIFYDGASGGTNDASVNFTETLSFASAPTGGSTLNFTNTASDAAGKYEAWTNAVGTTANSYTTTVVSPGSAQFDKVWITPALEARTAFSGRFIFTGNFTEETAVANVSPIVKVYKVSADLGSTTLVGWARLQGEAGTTSTNLTNEGIINCPAISANERLMFEVWTSSCQTGNQAAGYTASLASTTASPTKVELPVTLTAASSGTPVNRDLQLIWNDRAVVNSTDQYIWNVQAVVNKTLQAIWNTTDTTAVGKTLQLIWNMRAAVGTTDQYIWNVRAAVAQTRQVIWNNLTSVNKTLQTIWNNRQTVGQTNQYVWNDRAVVSKTLQTIWTVLAVVNQTRQLVWNNLTAVGKTNQYVWNVSATVGKSLQAIWNVRAAVAQTAQLVWHVLALAATTPVGQNLQLIWNQRATIAQQLQTIWNMRAVVGTTDQYIWNTRQSVSLGLSLRWNVLIPVAATKQLVWNLRVNVGNTRQIIWNDATIVSKTLQAIWNSSGPVGKTLQLAWNLRQTVNQTRQLVWNDLISVAQTRQLVWKDLTTVSKTFQAIWNDRMVISDDLTLIWKVDADLWVEYHPSTGIWTEVPVNAQGYTEVTRNPQTWNEVV